MVLGLEAAFRMATDSSRAKFGVQLQVYPGLGNGGPMNQIMPCRGLKQFQLGRTWDL